MAFDNMTTVSPLENRTLTTGTNCWTTTVTTTMSPEDDLEAWIDDATWILTSSFIIFTMQSGFGLLESGMASRKNEVNIMVKNVVDVVFGGLTYWAIGYGLTFGDSPGSNGFSGFGSFFLNPDEKHMGTVFSKFIFQASFCTTATTIVSGAVAERTKLTAYIVFCLLNTLVYSFPAHWIWAPNGWLKRLHVVDVAGVGPVHLVGGTTALIAAIMVKPRYGRFSKEGGTVHHGNSVNALLGLFILWWGWLGFNCGSTFGISGGKWKLAARSAATTILAACGGGTMAFVLSFFIHKGKFDIGLLVNGILGALVSITGICAVTKTWVAVVIGGIGACVTAGAEALLVKLKIDDPVGATAVHLAGSLWGMISCGLFATKDNVERSFSFHDGLFWGGGWYLLGVQLLAIVVIMLWTVVTSSIILKGIDLTIGLRMTLEEELYGADYFEHNVEPTDDIREHAEKLLREMTHEERTNPAYVTTRPIWWWWKKRSERAATPKSEETDSALGDMSDDSVIKSPKKNQNSDHVTEVTNTGNDMGMTDTDNPDKGKSNGHVIVTGNGTPQKHSLSGHSHTNNAFWNDSDDSDDSDVTNM
ncbi:ammonium transporter 2-like [Mizuhopecten yessoensis]|uniref:Ammonium transporter n=1 Tax=Mizuhopecten yessoensis TaxID=6573 RepID=A0A210QB90_MIZYE|nr:ammonium transporter 2-like [Mizuhopecten yessoensis]OWF45994.1 ammonium transporter 3 [Mizuhopecten yessoensis]